ncbi:hypothetical protein ACJ5NV_06590 [Loktanella agnita]|uniref:hypothetical protein n=1 Tax=Loktanella agnita TaxID=287097 RepID=UPI003985E492
MKLTLTPSPAKNTERLYLVSNPLTNGGLEIGSWLQDDVVSVDGISFWREKIARISNENIVYLGSGNAHHVYIVGPYVYIFCEYVDEQQVMMHTHDFLQLLDKYETYLAQISSGLPQSFETVYAHDGSAAAAIYKSEKSK